MSTGEENKPNRMQPFWAAVVNFAVAPASPRPMGVLRIGMCSVLLIQALYIASSANDLFGRTGIMQWVLADAMLTPGVPRLSWLTPFLGAIGISEVLAVRLLFILYVTGISALLVGWHSRIAAVISYLTHLILIMHVRGSLYGVDDFAHIILFYSMFFPMGHWGSLDKLEGRVKGDPSWWARLSLRVLQIHLCIVYFSSGIEKAFTPPYQWLDGEVIWRSLMFEEFKQYDLSWVANYPWMVMSISWGTLVIEIGYLVFVWPKLTRKWWAGATVAMHVGIAVFMGLWTFAGFMSVLTIAAFLTPYEPTTTEQKASGTEKKDN